VPHIFIDDPDSALLRIGGNREPDLFPNFVFAPFLQPQRIRVTFRAHFHILKDLQEIHNPTPAND